MRYGELPDAELVRQFQQGDAAAFDAFVRRHQDRLFRLASVWLYDPQRAGDAAQEVFIRAFRGLGRFRHRAEPFTWLYRTTRNVCREFNRERRDEPLPETLTSNRPQLETDALRSETAREVRAMVAGLPPRQREVVMLRIFEDCSVRESARAMGCREGTVKALLHKATNTLRRRMQRGDGDDG